jgi:hypothetical protein
MGGLLLAGMFSCGIVGRGTEGSLVAGMDAGVDSFGKLAATAAGIVLVDVLDDDSFGSLLGVSTVAFAGLGGDRACDVLPGALEAIVADLRRKGLRRDGPASTLSSRADSTLVVGEAVPT